MSATNHDDIKLLWIEHGCFVVCLGAGAVKRPCARANALPILPVTSDFIQLPPLDQIRCNSYSCESD
ncbi:MAG: hypothetical protein WCI85_04480, partial [Comamonadaceae bacterium]